MEARLTRRSSKTPDEGFLRHRFIFGAARHRAPKDSSPTSRMKCGQVLSPSGELLAQVDDSSPKRIVVSFGEDNYVLMPLGRWGGRILSPGDDTLVEIAPSKRAVLAKNFLLFFIPFSLMQCTGILSAFPLLYMALLVALMAFIIALMSADRTARMSAGGMAWQVTEGLGAGDYRVSADGKQVLQVYRDNGRTLDDYDVDVLEGFDTRLALLMALAFHHIYPNAIVPGEYQSARGIAQRGPRPEHS